MVCSISRWESEIHGMPTQRALTIRSTTVLHAPLQCRSVLIYSWCGFQGKSREACAVGGPSANGLHSDTLRIQSYLVAGRRILRQQRL